MGKTTYTNRDPMKPHEGWTPGDLDYYVIPQRYEDYTEEEHETWTLLYNRQMDILQGRAVPVYLDAIKELGITNERIPNLEHVNKTLKAKTGWELVGVPGIIPEAPFFEMLANRKFPAGTFIRLREQMDYLEEPDIFHDLFGHAPMLSHPVFADYIATWGRGGMKASHLKGGKFISRLYWFTVEFGLMQTAEGLRIYGAGILSSPTESVFSLESDSPNRIKFDLKRIMRTKYWIDDFQENYFVIDNFNQLMDATKPDFAPIYEELRKLPTLQPGEIAPEDDLITKGTQDYARSKGRI